MTSDQLRSAYAAYTAGQSRHDRRDCPSVETLEQLACDHDGATPRQGSDIAALEHVLVCDFCRNDFNLLRSVAETGRLTNEIAHVDSTKAHSGTWSRKGILLAASILIVALAGGETLRRLSRIADDTPVLRSDSSDVTLVSPASAARLSSAADMRRFTWRPVEGASGYALEILDTTGTVLVSRITPDTSIALSDTELNRVVSSTAIDWMVTARRGDGNERRSPLMRVR